MQINMENILSHIRRQGQRIGECTCKHISPCTQEQTHTHTHTDTQVHTHIHIHTSTDTHTPRHK